MKKIFRKKQGDSQPISKSLKQSFELMSNSLKDNKALEKFYKSLQRKQQCTGRGHSNKSRNSSDLDPYYNGPKFRKPDSLSTDLCEESSTSKNYFRTFSNRNEGGASEFVDVGDITSSKDPAFHVSKSASEGNLDSRSRSEGTIEQFDESLFVKKTDGKSNYSFYNSHINSMSDNELQHVADRNTFTDETSSEEATVRSNALFSKSLRSKICTNSQRGRNRRIDKKLLSSMRFQKIKKKVARTNKPVAEKMRKGRQVNAWRNTEKTNISFLSNKKVRIMNLFVKKQNSPEKTPFTQRESKRKRKKKIKIKKAPPVFSKEDLEIKQNLLDFLIHILHLIFITTIAVSMVSSTMYYFSSNTAALFFNTRNTPAPDFPPDEENKFMEGQKKTLKESITIDDFWAFAESTLIDMLYSKFFNPDTDLIDESDKGDKNMFYENQMLGVARLRQVRVRSDSCQIHPAMKRFFNSCFYYYSVFSEDVEPIKKGMEGTSTATAWEYSEAKALDDSYYWGEISVYGGGGYYLDLAPNKRDALEMIKQLKKNTWVSKATRAVFIDFNLYNANTNLFCICKIVLEIMPAGGMIPKAEFHSLKLIRYLSAFDFFILGCEIIYAVFTVYNTFHLFIILTNQGLSFFVSFWNYIDILILGLSYTYGVLSVLRYIYTSRLIYELGDNYNRYTEFGFVKELQIHYNNIIAILLFLCWIKLLNYFNFTKRLVEFGTTLSKSLKDILWFLPFFLITLFAFAILGNLFFGIHVKDFSTVWASFVTLLLPFVGNFKYHDVMDANQFLGPIFVIVFIFFIVCLLLNVFVAIVFNAYTSVKSGVMLSEPGTTEYLRRGFVNFFTCCQRRSSKKFNVNKVKEKILFQEIQKALQKAGFTTTEIKIFFCKYNINCDNFLNECTKTRLMEDLELRRVDFNDTSEQTQINVLKRKVDVLREKIENLEINLVPVIDKVDILLHEFK